MKSELPLVLQLAEPKMIAGDLDIQLSSRTNTHQKSATFSLGVLNDLVSDVAIDDVIA
jgi:hypothetical protein